jgi:phage terminase large subunit GpA-like protein
MFVVACDAPFGQMEPAPVTSLPFHTGVDGDLISAFWTTDDAYVIKADGAAGERWFRIDAVVSSEAPMAEDARRALGALLADIIPMGGGRVAFPVGSTGRRTYRVWRAAKGTHAGRTRILGVRAARSRRLPA